MEFVLRNVFQKSKYFAKKLRLQFRISKYSLKMFRNCFKFKKCECYYFITCENLANFPDIFGIFVLTRVYFDRCKLYTGPSQVPGELLELDCSSPRGLFGQYVSFQMAERSVLVFLNNLWGAWNRIGIGLSYRPARLHRLAELIPWK
jgi:hypothetical protein